MTWTIDCDSLRTSQCLTQSQAFAEEFPDAAQQSGELAHCLEAEMVEMAFDLEQDKKNPSKQRSGI